MLVFFISILEVQWQEFLTQFFGKPRRVGLRLQSSPNVMRVNNLSRNAIFKYLKIPHIARLLSLTSALLPSKSFRLSRKSIQKGSDMAASVRMSLVSGSSMANLKSVFATLLKVICSEIQIRPLTPRLLVNCSHSTPHQTPLCITCLQR